MNEVRDVFKQFQSFADSINKQKESGYNYIEVTASPYTVQSSDDIIVVNMAGACTVNIPALSIMGDGFEFMVIRAGAGAVTIDASGSENINGSTTYSIGAQWDSVTISNDGAKWLVTANRDTKATGDLDTRLTKIDTSGSSPTTLYGTTLKRPTAGSLYLLDDADLGIEVHDGGIISTAYQSGCRVGLVAADQTLTVSTHNVIIFEDETYDVQSEYNTSTGYFTAQKAGKYLVTVQVLIDVGVSGETSYLGIRKNSSWLAISTILDNNTYMRCLQATDILPLAANDTISATVYPAASAATIKAISERYYTFMTIQKVA